MSTEILPTAEGDLGRTPFAHLLVYSADQQLTGALFLHVPGGIMHSVRLECGRPVKTQMGDGFARLGSLMVEAGVIDQKTHDLPRVVPGLIGESLVAGEHISRETLNHWVERQFYVRMTRLFGLPAETRYAYFADMHEIIDDGAPNVSVHPLATIWAGLREHAEASVMMKPLLERVGKVPLKLHQLAGIERLKPTPDERTVLDRLRESPQSLRGLVATNPEEERLLRRMAYGLVILRFIDFGTEALPLFPEKPAAPPATSTSTVALGRIQLQQQTSRRFIAAADDDVGDGERIRPQPRARKRSRASKSGMAAVNPTVQMPAVNPTVQMPAVRPTVQMPAVTTHDLPPDGSSEQTRETGLPPLPVVTNRQTPGLAMFDLARTRLSSGDRQGALAACMAAQELDPNQPDYAVFAAWIRAVLGGANLESCVCELDKILAQCPDHVSALFYRGYLRRRTADEMGAVMDLRRVLELDPTHEDALRELKRIERRTPAKRPSGLYQG